MQISRLLVTLSARDIQYLAFSFDDCYKTIDCNGQAATSIFEVHFHSSTLSLHLQKMIVEHGSGFLDADQRFKVMRSSKTLDDLTLPTFVVDEINENFVHPIQRLLTSSAEGLDSDVPPSSVLLHGPPGFLSFPVPLSQ